jgi:hypothetical protein
MKSFLLVDDNVAFAENIAEILTLLQTIERVYQRRSAS